MTDPSLKPQPTLLDDLIVAFMLARAADEALSDRSLSPSDRLKAMGDKLIIAKDMIAALRLLAPGISEETHPDEIRARAVSNDAQRAAQQAIFTSAPIAAAISKRLDLQAASDTLASARKSLARATGQARAAGTAATAADREGLNDLVVNARGAVKWATERQAAAAEALRALQQTAQAAG